MINSVAAILNNLIFSIHFSHLPHQAMRHDHFTRQDIHMLHFAFLEAIHEDEAVCNGVRRDLLLHELTFSFAVDSFLLAWPPVILSLDLQNLAHHRFHLGDHILSYHFFSCHVFSTNFAPFARSSPGAHLLLLLSSHLLSAGLLNAPS